MGLFRNTTEDVCADLIAKREAYDSARRQAVVAWVLVAISLAGNVGVIYQQPWGMGCWVVSNVGWIAHHHRRKDYPSACLFAVYLALAIWGLATWMMK